VTQSDETAMLSLAARSNPSPGSASLTFALPTTGFVELDLYDIRGRLVRSLLREELAGGAHEAAWDGTSRSGTAAASGVYFAALRHKGATVTTKLILLR